MPDIFLLVLFTAPFVLLISIYMGISSGEWVSLIVTTILNITLVLGFVWWIDNGLALDYQNLPKSEHSAAKFKFELGEMLFIVSWILNVFEILFLIRARWVKNRQK